eukprot:1198899-Pyramimonas_sp.AAC.1
MVWLKLPEHPLLLLLKLKSHAHAVGGDACSTGQQPFRVLAQAAERTISANDYADSRGHQIHRRSRADEPTLAQQYSQQTNTYREPPLSDSVATWWTT